MINKSFWGNKKVFITGHTGFKGAWLCLWLHSLGAKVTGYALSPPTNPSLYSLCGIEKLIDKSYINDIRDLDTLSKAIQESKPEIIIHMAAQPLVRESYINPVETYAINVMGTVNLLESARGCKSVKAIVNVTTDKCYDNKEWIWGYRENEQLGGYDPYSNSKACSELVTSAYRNSFFNVEKYEEHGVAIGSARAGNVIGGGDWAMDRLIPDTMNALLNNKDIILRNPSAIRPWQHVLEPISGYLLLAQQLYNEGIKFAEAWNFGPDDNDAKKVEWIVKNLCDKWGGGAQYSLDTIIHPHEANHLKLDCSKAKGILGWEHRWNLEKTLQIIIDWYKSYQDNQDIKALCMEQILNYENS